MGLLVSFEGHHQYERVRANLEFLKIGTESHDTK